MWGVIALLAVWIAFNALLYGSIFLRQLYRQLGRGLHLTLDNFIRKLFRAGMSDGAWLAARYPALRRD